MLNTLLRDSTMDRLSREMDRLFGMTSSLFDPGLIPTSATRSATQRWPGVNVWRDGDQLVAEAELPGFRLEDIEVLATEDSLTIRGQRRVHQPEGATPLRLERSMNSFERTLRMPLQIDADKANASLENGVLRVTLPVAESARPKRISVKPIDAGEESRTLTGSHAHEKAAGASCS